MRQRPEFLSLTESFFKAGKITKLDLFRAKSQVSDARHAPTVAKNALLFAREILVRTIGLKEQAEGDTRGRFPAAFSPLNCIHSSIEVSLNESDLLFCGAPR